MTAEHGTRRVRIGVDIALTVGLLFCMGYQLWGPSLHEWCGAFMLCLLIVHHVLNRRWYPALLQGRYTSTRVLSTCTDLALLAVIALLLWSGIGMSQYVFTFLPSMGGLATMRRMHLCLSGWAFVLMAFHLGLHWHLVGRQAARKMKTHARVWKLLGLAVAVYGIVVVCRDLLSNMLGLTEFAFMDYEANPVLFYLEYSAAFEAFVFVGWAAMRMLRDRKQKR